MCNLYSNRVSSAMLAAAFAERDVALTMPEGIPNAEPRDEIRITDRAPVIRAHEGCAELISMRWSWPGPSGRPVFNYRAEGRRFDHARCLIPADAFYEHTEPALGTKRKTRWRFASADENWFCIAGLWRALDAGENAPGACFTMLTVEPGPDVAPIHSRQVALVARADWCGWLDGSARAEDVLGPSPAGALSVTRIG